MSEHPEVRTEDRQVGECSWLFQEVVSAADDQSGRGHGFDRVRSEGAGELASAAVGTG